ncbi:hypothetical protein AAHA92_05231 [Salvia divinorum]|uniref:Uncharacterized protein n=1 Tax=Salvia divinorum TaxID=28513 RepID=A0ABD1I1S7_SALDI
MGDGGWWTPLVGVLVELLELYCSIDRNSAEILKSSSNIRRIKAMVQAIAATKGENPNLSNIYINDVFGGKLDKKKRMFGTGNLAPSLMVNISTQSARGTTSAGLDPSLRDELREEIREELRDQLGIHKRKQHVVVPASSTMHFKPGIASSQPTDSRSSPATRRDYNIMAVIGAALVGIFT